MIDGKYKLKSFKSNKPTRLHRLQFIVLAIVKGRGIESALFVAMTFFTAANGDANNIIYLEERSETYVREKNSMKQKVDNIIAILCIRYFLHQYSFFAYDLSSSLFV